jgi:cytidine deaminase
MLEDLFEAALAARGNAYAPYSRFKVGAAIRSRSGRIHVGCNVENAAFPVGTCAEAGAISAMISAGEGTAGGGHAPIVEILVLGWTDARPDASELTTPCGGCRQRIREFAGGSAPIHIAGPEGVRRTFTLGDLLPQSFGPENLE